MDNWNKDIGDCIKECQLRAWSYENAIEWIPFDKLLDIKEIGKDKLDNVHRCAYIHADFHSGNILQDQQSYIADLELSKKKEDNASESETYSVMPYVPPEVLTGKQQFTQAADIYSLVLLCQKC
ncbi:hypothetical protein C2G38_2036039 [Gigaspora rosea]|uniref:Protein kinase domain-containing protein n=1 Tax=Gigaspora rosea TaxID=44941 RepID=A0A397VDQ8_9GLOM|nr:hypothetical protein C2G38_2036039 [Gigaspora rosea]